MHSRMGTGASLTNMPDNDKIERRRAQWRAASKKRRQERADAGLPLESGPSGGATTNAERQRRWRERQKKKPA